MDKAFVSSVMEEFSGERAAVRRAAESLGLRVSMAETAPSSPEPSKHALLPLVEQADVVLLVLGARYGWTDGDGISPTDHEYRHAEKVGTPVLAFVQSGVEREPAQAEFVARVSGSSWDEGVFRSSYRDAEELGWKVVQALGELQRGGGLRQHQPAAQERARELAREQGRGRGFGGPSVRVVFVPVGSFSLIDAVSLDDASLGDRLAGVLRASGLVSQAQAIDVAVSSAGVVLTAEGAREASTAVGVEAGGAVVVEGPAGTAGGSFALSAFSLPRISGFLERSARLALDLWGALEGGDAVRQVAAVVSVPDAGSLPLSIGGVVGSSMRMGSSSFGGDAAMAPVPALVVSRGQVAARDTTHRLAVSLKQQFADYSTVID